MTISFYTGAAFAFGLFFWAKERLEHPDDRKWWIPVACAVLWPVVLGLGAWVFVKEAQREAGRDV